MATISGGVAIAQAPVQIRTKCGFSAKESRDWGLGGMRSVQYLIELPN